MPHPAEIVQSTYAAFARRDLPQILTLLAPDVLVVQSNEMPWGGVYRGFDGVQQFFGRLTTYINSVVEIERLIAAGDHVVAVGRTRGRVVATAAAFDVPFAHVWRITQGLVAEVRFYIDHPAMHGALNAQPPEHG